MPQRHARDMKTKKIFVPTKCRGAIIGVQGATIKGLESKHNTKVTLQDQAELTSAKESYVNIAGKTMEDVEATEVAIMEVVVKEQAAQKAKFEKRNAERRARQTAEGKDGERGDRRRYRNERSGDGRGGGRGRRSDRDGGRDGGRNSGGRGSGGGRWGSGGSGRRHSNDAGAPEADAAPARATSQHQGTRARGCAVLGA